MLALASLPLLCSDMTGADMLFDSMDDHASGSGDDEAACVCPEDWPYCFIEPHPWFPAVPPDRRCYEGHDSMRADNAASCSCTHSFSCADVPKHTTYCPHAIRGPDEPGDNCTIVCTTAGNQRGWDKLSSPPEGNVTLRWEEALTHLIFAHAPRVHYGFGCVRPRGLSQARPTTGHHMD